MLSLLPVLCAGDAARALEGSSRLALGALPWLALLGLPRERRADGPARVWPSELGFAAPLLALGAWFDLQAGLSISSVGATGAMAAILLAFLGEARDRAGSGRAYGAAWFALVAGAPALAAALGSGSSGVGPPFSFLAFISPIGWAWERTRAAGGEVSGSAFARPLIGTLVIFLIAAGSSRSKKGAP